MPRRPERADLTPGAHRVTHQTVEASGGAMTAVGIGTIVLGILALLGIGPIATLGLVALLATGAALVVSGGTLTAWFLPR